MPQPIKRTLAFAATVLLSLNFMHAQLQFERAGYQLPSAWFEEVELPRPSIMRAAFLNYETFAADIGWVALVVNYGEGRHLRARLESLEENATVVRDLDPRFRRLYDWFPAIYLNQVYPTPFSRAETTLNFVRPGFDVFPTDGSLPFHASMSFIGIQDPEGEGPERRYETIIELAEFAAVRGDPDAAGVLPFYRAKLANGGRVDPATQIEFLLALFARATTERERRLLQAQIRALSKNRDATTAAIDRINAFTSRHTERAAYASPELFALVFP